jgi:ABC-type multidrug transport system fused ATPase/permease subunit
MDCGGEQIIAQLSTIRKTFSMKDETVFEPVSNNGKPIVNGVTRQSKSQLAFVLNLIMPYRKWLLLIFIALLIETVMSLAAPWPLKIILDNVIENHKLPLWFDWIGLGQIGSDKMGLALVAAITVILIAVVGAVASYIDSYYTESVAQYVANDLRQKIYHHLQRLSLRYFNTHQTGNMLNTITEDVGTIQNFASSSLLGILVDAMTILGMLGLMFFLNWEFALVAVGITPFLLFFVIRFKKLVKKATHKVRANQSHMFSVLQQGLESERTVTAFGRQELEEQKLTTASFETVSSALKARRIKSLLSPVVGIVVSFCIAIVLWRGTSLTLSGTMTIGALTVIIAYLNKFFKPVQDLAKMTNSVAQATVALERIQSVLDTDDIIFQKPKAKSTGILKGEISFDHVAFGYDQDTPVLTDIHFTIKAGQRIGICGPTGGGKSTVVSLIPRFYDPTDGRVLIDGVNIVDYKLEELRAQIGFVLQDTVLFYGNVRDNIAYGRPGATEEEIRDAARLAYADEFIDKMPKGLDAIVGEKGLTLSGGQRQRIGIARALIRNSPILILDEPTAALDTESEEFVMKALEVLMKGRTVITIAHRLSTIRDADKIIVVKGGFVAEEGTHEELIAHNGIYAELDRIQKGSLAVQRNSITA